MTKIFNKFDIITIFNKIRIKKRNEKKFVFLIHYDLFEYIIISFKVCNIFNTFQIFITGILRKYFDDFCSAYLNDILIYNNNKKEYIGHVKKILKKFKQIDLYLDINKYKFYVKEIKYLDLIIIIEKLKIDSKKIEIIVN